MKYRSNKEGKAQFVEEVLKPLILNIEERAIDVTYVIENGLEWVSVSYKDPERSFRANVTCDSIQALVYDVLHEYYIKFGIKP